MMESFHWQVGQREVEVLPVERRPGLGLRVLSTRNDEAQVSDVGVSDLADARAGVSLLGPEDHVDEDSNSRKMSSP